MFYIYTLEHDALCTASVLVQCSGEEYNRCVDLYTGLFSLSNLVTGSDFEQNEWKTSTEIQGGVQRTISFNKIKHKRSGICILHLLPTRHQNFKWRCKWFSSRCEVCMFMYFAILCKMSLSHWFFLQLYSIYCLIAFRFMFHFPQIEYTFCTYIRLQEIFQLKREI